MPMLKENNFDVSKTRKIPVPRAAEAYGRRLKISCVFLNYSNFTGFTNPLLHQGQTSRSFPTTPVVFQPNPPSAPLTAPIISSMNVPSSEGLARPSRAVHSI